MPCIPLHPPSSSTIATRTTTNPLPTFLHTPSGLAILELQGNIQIEQLSSLAPPPSIPPDYHTQHLPIGILAFPPDAFTLSPQLTSEGGKRGKNGLLKELGGAQVLLFVGKYQKLRGEVRELGKPLGVMRRRRKGEGEEEEEEGGEGEGEGGREEVEIVDVVRWKVVFSTRPEPVG